MAKRFRIRDILSQTAQTIGILLAVSLALFVAPGIASNSPRPVVVLDPGHGGFDEGATLFSRAIREKDITLAVARKTQEILEQSDVEVRLTRSGDQELSVFERTAYANRLRARLFVSLHVNSSPGAEARGGIETYVLNRQAPRRDTRLAELRNAVLSDSQARPTQVAHQAEQDDPSLPLIVKDLMLEGNLPESRHMACAIQSELVDTVGRGRDRGVKSSLFYVLLGADMPSSLVELGFLNHVEDRQLLLSPSGQVALARSVARGILRTLKGESRDCVVTPAIHVAKH